MQKPFRKNAKVSWRWLGGVVPGVIVEVHFEPLTKILKGKKIKRNGSRENPAYLVRSDAGNFALKLHTELSPRAKVPRFDVDLLKGGEE